MFNLATILDDNANRRPEHDAFIFADKSYTYKEINSLANRVANALKKIGVSKGEKVALSCINSPIFPVIYFGVLKSGAVVVPLNVLLKRSEIAFQLQNSDCKLFFYFVPAADSVSDSAGYRAFEDAVHCQHFIPIVSPAGSRPGMEGLVSFDQFIEGCDEKHETLDVSPGDTASIIFSSGTTGNPKGAELTHRGLLESARATITCMDIHEGDVSLLVLPMFHIFGMSVCMNTAVLLGMTTVILPKFQPEDVLKCLIKYKITVFGGVPTMYWGLLNYEGDIPIEGVRKHLRTCVSGGAPLPVKLLKDFEARFGVSILEGYGMTEGSGAVSLNPSAKIRKPGASGLALDGIDVVILDENQKELPPGNRGELCYRGAVVMKGYYNNPEATQQALVDGWMHSGDVAVKDEDGYVFIVDRTKDMIIRSGYKVYPREVEEVMMRHEAVSMVAIVGIPDDRLGEEIKAYVILKTGVNPKGEVLMEWVGQQMASYKVPRLIEFVDSLPLGPTGKVLKRELRLRK
jgi:long-chain acyl-CoA synthetase